MIVSLKQAFGNTKFGKDVPIVPVSAYPKSGEAIGLDDILFNLLTNIKIPT